VCDTKKHVRQKKNRSNQQPATQNHRSSLTPEILAPPHPKEREKVAGVVAKSKLEAQKEAREEHQSRYHHHQHYYY
jgi:hypothetical protein